MGRRHRTWLIGSLLVVGGCASDANGGAGTDQAVHSTTAAAITSAPSTTAATTSTVAATTATVPVGVSVQATIDIGGQELLGLAADTTSVWAVTFQGAKLARVDPQTNTVTATIAIDGAASVLSQDGVLWVATYGGSHSLHRIDANSATEAATVDAGEVCCDLTFGNGLIWVVDPSGAVKGINPATNDVVKTFPVEVDRNAHTNVVHGGNSLWVSSDTTMLHRVDPSNGAIVDIDVGGGVPFVDRDGLMWGASPTELWAVDETTGEVAKRIQLSRSIEVLSLDIGTDSLWVGIRHPGRIGAVQHVDIATGNVLDEFKVSIPARIVFGFGSVWVTDSGSSSLYRLGPFTER